MPSFEGVLFSIARASIFSYIISMSIALSDGS